MGHKLTWKPYIEYIKRKVCKSIVVLHKAKDILDYVALAQRCGATRIRLILNLFL